MVRTLLIICIIIFSPVGGAHAAHVNVFFTPGPDCEEAIGNALNRAVKEVSAAVYSINNAQIIAALVAAKKRGVKVRILTDRVQAAGRGSKAFELLEQGFDLRVHSKYKIEHNKFLVTDSGQVITGSFNWTTPATKHNSENCVLIEDGAVGQKFQQRFDELWALNTAEKSQAYVARIKAKRDPRLPASR